MKCLEIPCLTPAEALSSPDLEPRPVRPRAHQEGDTPASPTGLTSYPAGRLPTASGPELPTPRTPAWEASAAQVGAPWSSPAGKAPADLLAMVQDSAGRDSCADPKERGKGAGVEDSPPEGPSHLRDWEKRTPLGEGLSSPNPRQCPRPGQREERRTILQGALPAPAHLIQMDNSTD